MRFTNRTGLENLTNQAVHELVEERKKKPLELEEADKQTAVLEQPKEKTEENTAQFTYGTNSTNSETHRRLFNGSYHTFSATSSNQMQCTCCPEPILFNVKDFETDKKETNYLTSSTFTNEKSDYLSSKSKKSSYTF